MPPVAPLPPPALVAAVTAACPGLPRGGWQALPGGRVNRLWRAGDHVVKLYLAEGASPLFPNAPAAEALVLRHLAGAALGPDLLAEGPDWIVYRHWPGAPWRQDTAAVAAALARLHRQAPPAGLRLLPMGAAGIAAHARAFAPQAMLPPLPDLAEPPPGPRVLVHGDAVPGNLIAGPDGLRLIDWQCPGAGDGVDDLALFLSPAMQQLYRGAPLSVAEAAGFLAAYPDRDTVARYRHLRPLLHWRIAAHCALRAAQGQADYAAALRLELAALQPAGA